MPMSELGRELVLMYVSVLVWALELVSAWSAASQYTPLAAACFWLLACPSLARSRWKSSKILLLAVGGVVTEASAAVAEAALELLDAAATLVSMLLSGPPSTSRLVATWLAPIACTRIPPLIRCLLAL